MARSIRYVWLLMLALTACAQPKPDLDISALTDLRPDTAQALVRDVDAAPETLTSAGIADRALQAFIFALVPELLADLSLFGADAAARPKDVRIVLLGQDSADIVVSQRGLKLYRTLADLLSRGQLRRLAVADLVLESRVAAISADAIDTGRKIRGATLTVVIQGVAHDGTKLLLTGD